MIIAVKLFLLAVLAIIAFQDFKERMVWIILFPFFMVLAGFLYYVSTVAEVFFYNILLNLIFIGFIILLCFLYAKLVVKKNFTSEVMGLGDILFFLGFAVSFPTITFLNFFFFSIIFTMIIHFLLKNFSSGNFKNIPLAGGMSLFLISVYSIHWFGFYNTIYSI